MDVSGAIRRVLKSCTFRAMGRGPRARGFTLKRLGLMRSPGTPTQPTGVPGPSLREFSLDYVVEPIAESPNFPTIFLRPGSELVRNQVAPSSVAVELCRGKSPLNTGAPRTVSSARGEAIPS